jgi:hypothetical protein
MQSTEDFTGLGMPVFAAFGWAGEETAQQYAHSQLQQFIALLHANLVPVLQAELPYFGWNPDDQSAYLASTENVANDVRITINARPTSLVVQMALTDHLALTRALKQISLDPEEFLTLLKQIDPQWSIHLHQAPVNEGSGAQIQELFKGTAAALDEASAAAAFEKAAALNSDDDWLTPFILGLRIPAEQVAAMQQSIIPILSERLESLAPLIGLLHGRSLKAQSGAEGSEMGQDEPAGEPVVPPEVLEQPDKPQSKDEFTFISELKPLHIERGFVNLTPGYWPFFAVNARTESRPVVTVAGDLRDEESSVWRLQPNDLARLVLGPEMHRWLEAHFVPGEYIQLTASRVDDQEIEILLDPIT